MSRPPIIDDPMYQLLRNEEIEKFNSTRDGADLSQLNGCNYRGVDLRGLNAEGLDFTDAYFHGADLRGIDFRTSKLEGASMSGAKISGCYFPTSISADEIKLSVNAGTRLRYDE